MSLGASPSLIGGQRLEAVASDRGVNNLLGGVGHSPLHRDVVDICGSGLREDQFDLAACYTVLLEEPEEVGGLSVWVNVTQIDGGADCAGRSRPLP